MGAGFSRLLVSKGFDIAIGNEKPEKAVALAKDIRALPSDPRATKRREAPRSCINDDELTVMT